MTSPAPTLKQLVQTARIFIAVFMMSCGAMAFTGWTVLQKPLEVKIPRSVSEPGVLVMLVMAGVILVLAERISGMFLTAVRKAGSGAGDDSRRVQGAFFTYMMVGLVLRETCTVISLVVTMLTRELHWVLAGAALSMASMAGMWPTEDSIRKKTGIK